MPLPASRNLTAATVVAGISGRARHGTLAPGSAAGPVAIETGPVIRPALDAAGIALRENGAARPQFLAGGRETR